MLRSGIDPDAVGTEVIPAGKKGGKGGGGRGKGGRRGKGHGGSKGRGHGKNRSRGHHYYYGRRRYGHGRYYGGYGAAIIRGTVGAIGIGALAGN